MQMKFIFSGLIIVFISLQSSGQSGKETDLSGEQWHHLDFKLDSVPGISTIRAYEEVLKNRESEKIIVAVLDDGIDISHEDLQGQIWTNQDEIPGNGVDDDGNGYIDDLHGWNFLGNPNGENLVFDTYELTRLYASLTEQFANVDTATLDPADMEQFNRYQEIKMTFEAEKEESELYYKDYKKSKENFDRYAERLKKYTGDEEITAELLDTLEIKRGRKAKKARKALHRFYSYGLDEQILEEGLEYLRIDVEYHYNPDFNPRSIIGDDPEDLEDRYYGNPEVFVEGQSHGTAVSALIGAARFNDMGIDGIAGNVELMPVKIVPDGDERDKDVANGIYYAVDNGAKILNMSFGKGYSPNEEYVNKAIRYAEEKGVLMVSGSGNDGQDNDSIDNFPNKYYSDGTECATWISVGATTRNPDSSLVTDFSNYGQSTVDLMAPGEAVLTLAPGNETDVVDGTSFSSPIVAGVAALIWSYFPELTAAELRNVLFESAGDFGDQEVVLPGYEEEQIVLFGDLSVTGGIVNAYEAALLAKKIQTLKSSL